jgi:hypothetical protein
MTVLDAVEKVLRNMGTAMHYKDIARQLLQDQRWKPAAGGAGATVNAQIVLDIKKSGKRSRFQRTGPGVFGLRDWGIDEYSSELSEELLEDDAEVDATPRVTAGYANTSEERQAPPEPERRPYLPAGRERRQRQRRVAQRRREREIAEEKEAAESAALASSVAESQRRREGDRRAEDRRRGQVYVSSALVSGDAAHGVPVSHGSVNRRATVTHDEPMRPAEAPRELDRPPSAPATSAGWESSSEWELEEEKVPAVASDAGQTAVFSATDLPLPQTELTSGASLEEGPAKPVAEIPAEAGPTDEPEVVVTLDESPVDEPPVEELPVEELPVEEPEIALPVEEPPVEELPVEEPEIALPVEEPPVEEPEIALPVEEPPVEELPVEELPVEEPEIALPVEEPPVEEPPVEEPPVEEPEIALPVEEPPVEEPVSSSQAATPESPVFLAIPPEYTAVEPSVASAAPAPISRPSGAGVTSPPPVWTMPKVPKAPKETPPPAPVGASSSELRDSDVRMDRFPRIPPFAEVVASILRAQASRDPLHYTEVASQACRMGWLSSAGPAEAAAMYAVAREEVVLERRLGRIPRFVIPGGGTIGLSEWQSADVSVQVEAHNREVQGKLLYVLRMMELDAFEGLMGRLLAELGVSCLQVMERDGTGGFAALGHYRTPFGFTVPLALMIHRGREGASDMVTGWAGKVPPSAYGVIVSTESFSPDFAARVQRLGVKKVRLVNGHQLVNLLISRNLGVIRDGTEILGLVVPRADE